MKRLFCVLTGLCLLTGLWTSCEKAPEKVGGTIKGVITDNETGSSISGVTIELQPTGKQVKSIYGAYVIEGLDAGTYTLKAQKDGYEDYIKEELILATNQILRWDIEMVALTPCALEGKVIDKETGSPLSGVTVKLQTTGDSVLTAEDGIYRFESLSARTYVLNAQKKGYVNYTKSDIQLTADRATMALDIEMEKEFVGFQITDEESSPIEEFECYGIECRFKIVNNGSIAGKWSLEYDSAANWITNLSPRNGTLAAGASQTITFKRKLQEEDKETVMTLKADSSEDLSLKIINKAFVMEVVLVEGGEFEMGGTSEQGKDAIDDETVRTIKLDSSFYIGKYEVTQAQWKAVMGTEPSNFKGDNFPVEGISWNEAQTFCSKLSEALGGEYKYVLPTEAQWEYAARGGNQSQHYKYAGSDDINEVAWYWANSQEQTHPVGTKKANELDIYDMSGNVGEWCSDWYGSYDENDTENPEGASSGTLRVSRGGSWAFGAWYSRVSRRDGNLPGNRLDNLGFRVVRISK